MAFDQAWMAVASLIAVFDIYKPVDASGNTIEPRYEYTAADLIRCAFLFLLIRDIKFLSFQ